MLEWNVPQYVQDLLTEIEQNAMADTERMAQLCDKLDQYANDGNDTFIRGHSLFYRGFNKYANAQFEQGMKDISASLNYLIPAQSWRLVGNAYNSMGNIADFQGDTSLAIDCYLKGLSVAIEHNIEKLEYTFRSSISNIYIGLGAYENAIAMLLECESLRENGVGIPSNPVIVVTANLVICYIQLGMRDKAEQKLNLLREIWKNDPNSMNSLLLCTLESQFYHLTGDSEALNAAIGGLASLELDNFDVFDAFNELILHAKLLLELGKIEEFNVLLRRLEEQVDSPSIEQKILDLQMMYYRKIGDNDGLIQKALRYCEVSKQCEQERNKIVNHNIATRMRLDDEERKRREIERSNLLLKQKSERDALTGLSNRYRLNEIAELAFNNAQSNGCPLAIEILDIDCYKEYNDNYGHQAGDECLISIAGAIRSLEEFEGVHTARYGGDEFVVIYENYSPEEVERMAQLLQSRIYDLNIEHRFSKVSDRVSISQGLFHQIPAEGNRIWDFLHGADMVLYGVKKRGKNSYHLETSFAGVTQYNEADAQ